MTRAEQIEAKGKVMGWNAFVDGQSQSENPYTMTSDMGWGWDMGYMAAERKAEKVGYGNVERKDEP